MVQAKDAAMTAFTTWDIVRNLVLAFRWTLALSLVALVGGGVLSLPLLVARVGRSVVARRAAELYSTVFQSTPLLMQLFLVFFGLGLWGQDVPAWFAATLTLIVWTAAFLSDIWRGCVEAVGRGQWEASASLGLRYLQQLRFVILPQALRIAIPPTVGFTVQVIKGTALTSIIGFVEVSRAGAVMANASYRPFTVYACVALIYLAVCWPLSRSSRWLERRLDAGH